MTLLILGVDVDAERIVTYNTVAASMFFCWDYLLTLDDEIEFIWRKPFSWGSFLFYYIRYLTSAIRIVHLVFCANPFGHLHITTQMCSIWRWFQVLSGQFLFIGVEILFITRVFALYGRKKNLLTFMVFFLILETIAMMVLVFTTLPKDIGIALPHGLERIHSAPCVGIFQPRQFLSLWIPPLLMQSLLSILVLFGFLRVKSEWRIAGQPAILTIFVRDHFWTFLMIFTVSLFATLSYQLSKHLGEAALTWTYSVLGFAGSRLVLNLKSNGQSQSRETVFITTPEMKFSDPTASCPSSTYAE